MDKNLVITCKNNSDSELEVVKLVNKIYSTYNFPKYTYDIIIDKNCIPYSKPLQINTRCLKEKDPGIYLLQVLIHENQHYFFKIKKSIGKIDKLTEKYGYLFDEMKYEFQDKFMVFIIHIPVCFNTINIIKNLKLKNKNIKFGYEKLSNYIISNFKDVKKFLKQLELVDEN